VKEFEPFQPSPPTHYMDAIWEHLESLSRISSEAPMTYAEGISLAHALRAEADRVQQWLTHYAALEVLDDERERTETELNYYRDREALRDWNGELPSQDAGDG
jgi:hypothetical protein